MLKSFKLHYTYEHFCSKYFQVKKDAPSPYYLDDYESANSFLPNYRRITKKFSNIPQWPQSKIFVEETPIPDIMRGLEVSLSFPFDVLRRRYLEGIMRNIQV